MPKRLTKAGAEHLRNKMVKLQSLGYSRDEIMKELELSTAMYYHHKKKILLEHPDPVNACSGKPFWIWSKDHGRQKKGKCCFNHTVGLPEKDGRPMPLFDYEEKIFDALYNTSDRKKDRHLWIKKATGLGISEFFLRYMAWMCYHDGSCKDAQMCIITGPNIELAKGLIRRLADICRPIDDDGRKAKQTVITMNGCRVEAFPSHHLDAMRSLTNPKFILIDEADFFPPKELKNARHIAERYIAKSDPYIVMVSTPNMPGGLYESIEKEPEERCVYRRIFLPCTVGIGKIYTEKEIQKAKESPSFEREYNLKYGYGTGDIFPYELVDQCVCKYDLALAGGQKVLAVDPGYGSSKFALLGAELLDDGIIYVKEAHQYDRPSPSGILTIVSIIAKRYEAVIVDGSHPEIVRELQDKGIDAYAVNFRKELQAMTLAASRLVQERQVRIHSAFTDLIYQLKSVKANAKGHPDKSGNLTFDLGDAFMLVCYHFFGRNELRMAKI